MHDWSLWNHWVFYTKQSLFIHNWYFIAFRSFYLFLIFTLNYTKSISAYRWRILLVIIIFESIRICVNVLREFSFHYNDKWLLYFICNNIKFFAKIWCDFLLFWIGIAYDGSRKWVVRNKIESICETVFCNILSIRINKHSNISITTHWVATVVLYIAQGCQQKKSINSNTTSLSPHLLCN